MSQPNSNPDRRDELRADRALFGLSDAERRELAALEGRADLEGSDAMPDEFEVTAAALDVSLQVDPSEPALPADLKRRILAASRMGAGAGDAKPQAAGREPVVGARAMWRRRELVAWLATAAALLVAFFVAVRRPGDDGLSPAELRARLLAQRGDAQAGVVQIAWTRGEDATGAEAEGDVVWSSRDQAGVMRFRGLAANDPTVNQYQLWIFDAERDERYPVDGGVFDVPADGDGDVLVGISARLPVARPTLFAITVERPGGVVVSDRSRLPLLAPVAP
jgi:anti-sigma-K factor RskA